MMDGQATTGPDWPRLDEIGWLILETDDFIVFIDKEDDLDWVTRVEPTKEASQKIAKIRAEVSNLEPRSSEWPREIKLAFRRLLGEALAFAFDGDFARAQQMVGFARGFWQGRSREVARVAYLKGCAIVSILILTLWFLLWWTRSMLPPTMVPVLTAVSAGSLGAMYSVLLRSNKVTLEPNSPTALHVLDGGIRIITGMLGALVVFLAWKLKVVADVVPAPERELVACAFIGLIAGASERFAPSILEKTSKSIEGLQHSVETGEKS